MALLSIKKNLLVLGTVLTLSVSTASAQEAVKVNDMMTFKCKRTSDNHFVDRAFRVSQNLGSGQFKAVYSVPGILNVSDLYGKSVMTFNAISKDALNNIEVRDLPNEASQAGITMSSFRRGAASNPAYIRFVPSPTVTREYNCDITFRPYCGYVDELVESQLDTLDVYLAQQVATLNITKTEAVLRIEQGIDNIERGFDIYQCSDSYNARSRLCRDYARELKNLNKDLVLATGNFTKWKKSSRYYRAWKKFDKDVINSTQDRIDELLGHKATNNCPL